MRPTIICHMITSLDGRLHPQRWSDTAERPIMPLVHRHYEATGEQIGADGWIIGRRTVAEFVASNEAPRLGEASPSRKPHIVDRAGRSLAIVLDPGARLSFETGELDGDHVVVILSQGVDDGRLAELRDAGVSYVFAGVDGRDTGLALETIGECFSVDRLLLEGGGTTNGAFLAEGLIDEVSTLVCPAIDGLAGVPAIYDHHGAAGSRPAAGHHLRLRACQTLDGGVVWLRHDVVPAD